MHALLIIQDLTANFGITTLSLIIENSEVMTPSLKVAKISQIGPTDHQ